jgi:uncharacterized protein YndB with AHSA1/START domain
MATGTVRLHRVLRATPEKVYRAFLDPDALVKWLPPHGFTGQVHHIDARVGGTYKMSFTNFTSGHGHSFGGTFLELLAHERIRHTDTFDDPNLPGEMQTTIYLKKVSTGEQEAAGGEIDVEDTPRCRLRADRHAACRTQGQQRDRAAGGDLVQMVVVRGHAVPTRLPRHAAAHRVEPVMGDFGRHEVRSVEDAAARVVHEDGLTGMCEER